MLAPDRFRNHRYLAAQNEWIGGMLVIAALLIVAGVAVMVLVFKSFNARQVYLLKHVSDSGKAQVVWQ